MHKAYIQQPILHAASTTPILSIYNNKQAMGKREVAAISSQLQMEESRSSGDYNESRVLFPTQSFNSLKLQQITVGIQ